MAQHLTEPVPMRSIVVGVDGSPSAARALSWAATRCLEVDGELVAVHVLTYDRELLRDLSLDTVTTWRRSLERELAGSWTDPARSVGALVRAELVEDDSIATGILRRAAAAHADLIVLGARGRGGLFDRLLGPTTYTVAHRARTPVVIVPADWEPVAA